MFGWGQSIMTFKCWDHEVEDCPTCEEAEQIDNAHGKLWALTYLC